MSDFFSLLGLPCSFALKADDLELAYKNAQKMMHPDQFSDSFEKKAAESVSSRLNEAYHLLKDPLKRAEILLEMRGLTLSSQTSPDILFTMMSWQDQLENALTTDQLDLFSAKVEDSCAHLMRELEEAFKVQDDKKALGCLEELKYMSRLKEQICCN